MSFMPLKALSALTLLCALSVGLAYALNAQESARVERLLAGVAASTDLTFIRNGSAHSAAEAAEHLRDKLNFAASRLNSAEEFIDKAASRSSLTGRPYLIVYPDGREETAAAFLTRMLEAQDAALKEERDE